MTLDDDVASKIKAEMRRSGRSFRDTVNSLLRSGLKSSRTNSKGPALLPPIALECLPGVSYKNISELFEQIE